MADEKYQTSLNWALVRIEALEKREAALREALEAADKAINPPDRNGISLDVWNSRLRVATTTIRAALKSPAA